MNKQKIIGYGILLLLMLSITFVMATDLLVVDKGGDVSLTFKVLKGNVCIRGFSDGIEFINISESLTLKEMKIIYDSDKSHVKGLTKCYTYDKEIFSSNNVVISNKLGSVKAK